MNCGLIGPKGPKVKSLEKAIEESGSSYKKTLTTWNRGSDIEAKSNTFQILEHVLVLSEFQSKIIFTRIAVRTF